MKTRASRKAGFTLVEIMIVVAIIGLLAAIAIPNFVKARTTSQQNACINNLRQFDGAAQQWALETKQLPSANATLSLIKPYIKLTTTSVVPSCPASGTYNSTWSVTGSPGCSLSGAPQPHILP